MTSKAAVKSATKPERKDSATSNQIALVEANSIQESVTPLTEAEQKHLAECEVIIEKGIKSFLEVADALLDVRDQKLYRVTHKTFQDYCADKWSISARHANRLMLGGEAVRNIESDQLVSSVPAAVPENEAQARPLASLPKDKQVAAARIVAKQTKKPTTKDFQAAADEVEEDESPRVKSYNPRGDSKDKPASAKNDEKDKLEKLLELVDQAETQARKIASCSDVVKVLSELSKTITRKLNGGAK